jgi:hypothetical protein
LAASVHEAYDKEPGFTKMERYMALVPKVIDKKIIRFTAKSHTFVYHKVGKMTIDNHRFNVYNSANILGQEINRRAWLQQTHNAKVYNLCPDRLTVNI